MKLRNAALTSRSARLLGLIGLTAAWLLVPTPADAQRRARMSQPVAEHVAELRSESLNVLYEGPQAEVDRLAQTYGVDIVRRLEMGAVLSGSGHELMSLSTDRGVRALHEDGLVFSTMATAARSTGASDLWRTPGGSGFGGYTGRGVTVALIDSGVSPHSDIEDRLLYSYDFTGGNGDDLYGHGTHLAGIIAGSGRGSRTIDGSQYIGVAPGAAIVSLKVLGADGTGYVSDVIAAIEFAVANRQLLGIRVLNLSLGMAPSGSYRDDPMAHAVERAREAGLVVVASAGNMGKTSSGDPIVGAVVSPGYTPGALTVGALNTRGTLSRADDAVASYSSRGPVGNPDEPSTWELKPDLVAPGNALISTAAVGSWIWETFPERHVIGERGGAYLTLSGSSQAAAVVAGAAAQLIQARPDITPDEVKFALQVLGRTSRGFRPDRTGRGKPERAARDGSGQEPFPAGCSQDLRNRRRAHRSRSDRVR